ncbi:hypothetical protein MRB53_042228 [Persea americana]|nr:hypothetical protein MRB53_042228 [Persea americana]
MPHHGKRSRHDFEEDHDRPNGFGVAETLASLKQHDSEQSEPVPAGDSSDVGEWQEVKRRKKNSSASKPAKGGRQHPRHHSFTASAITYQDQNCRPAGTRAIYSC